jgi:hypothetical protein
MKNPGKTTIGDLRIKYFVSTNDMENGMLSVSVLGEPRKETQIVPHRNFNKMVEPGMMELANFVNKHLK